MISIDPGKHTGWAWFLDEKLIACGLGRPEVRGEVPLDDLAVIERPTIYPRSPVPPNDIIELAITAGRIAAGFERVEWVLPRRWKGTIPKAIMGERILAKLTPAELARIPSGARHDVIDAIGLGLWYLKRLTS